MSADTAALIAALRADHATRPAGSEQYAQAGPRGVWLLLDADHRLHLCIRRSGGSLPAPLEHVGVATRTGRFDGQPLEVVDVWCRSTALEEVFEHFIGAYLVRAGTAVPPVRALDAELAAWRAFLALPPGPPGTDRCAETVGELLVARDLCRVSLDVLSAWVGDRHDFRAGATAVEVKTTRSTTGYRVTAHGVDQMLAPASDGSPGSLHLHLVRLEHTPGAGVSVHSLTEELVAAGAGTEQVWSALGRHGIAPVQIEASRAVTFQIRERLTVPVDDGFPRVVPASFLNGHVPPGVDDITYSVNLGGLLDRCLTADAWETLLSRLASAATVA